jgi:hypothetical protein
MVLLCQLSDEGQSGRAYAGRLHSPAISDLLLQGLAILSKDFLGGACLPLGVGRADWFARLPDDEPFILMMDDVDHLPGSPTATATVTAIALDGKVFQRFSGITMVSTKDMAEKFRESTRWWLAADRSESEEVSPS